MGISEEFVRKTIEFWSPRYGYLISRQEALEIIETSAVIFRKLIIWEGRRGEKAKNFRMVEKEM